MQRITPPPLDRRLQKRFSIMVKSHMQSAPPLAAGVASLPSVASSKAATQAAWRFLNNENVTLSALVQPLREEGAKQTDALNSPFVLLVHDWSKIGFKTPKEDSVQLTHEDDVGYDLNTALLVSPDDGKPIAPMEMHLRTSHGTLSTRDPAPRTTHHLKQLLPTMKASSSWNLSKPIVHVIDREADSVNHYRDWDAKGHKFLVRADDRRVQWNDSSTLLSEICCKLRQQKKFSQCGNARYQGRSVPLWIAETEVVLNRPGRKNVGGKKVNCPGRPLKLRLIVVQIRDKKGKVLAEWKLLSNVPLDWADAQLLGRCYYWRWQIESFFKLLKGHGHQLEHWQQESGRAIARRLLVASMACVVVWLLQADKSQEAEELKHILIQLSGRQMKWNCKETAPALLAGLWNLLSMLELLEHNKLSKIKSLAASLPMLDTG